MLQHIDPAIQVTEPPILNRITDTTFYNISQLPNIFKGDKAIYDVYLRFSGEYLHDDCLIDYLQKLRILDVVITHSDYNPCEVQKK